MENEYPCDIESVISIKLNFENLKVFLEFLDKKNNKNQSQINDIYNKLKEVDIIKEDIKEINNQISIINIKQEEMNGTINYHSSKLLEFEKNYVSMDERIIKLENESIANKKKFSEIDQSIDNLNKVTEDNSNKIDKLGYFLNSLKAIVDSNCEKLESHDKSIFRLEEELKKMDVIRKELNDFKDKTKTKIKKLKQHNEEQRKINKNIQSKISEIDDKMDKLNETLNELSVGIKMNSFNGHTNSHELGSNNFRDDGSNSGKVFFELTELKLRFENFTKDYDLFKKNYKNHINSNQVQENTNQEKKEKDKKGKSNTINPEEIEKIFEKITLFDNEISNLKEKSTVIFYSLEEKICKDDLDRIIKTNSIEIDKLAIKVNELMNKSDNKLKGMLGEGGQNENGHDMVELAVGKEIFSDEIQLILNDSLINNDIYKNLIEKNDKSSEEIVKIFESLVELRKISIENKELIDKNFDEKEKVNILSKINSLDNEVENLKVFAERKIKTEEENQGDSLENLMDYVRNLSGNFKVIEEKVDKTAMIQNNLDSEIYSKLKKDLAIQSSKILEEFRSDLKKSVLKLEEKLHHKVDKFNLDEFGKKLDTKFIGEIQKKIDKSDLRRSNSYFSKKFDHLENKISKTLVDTLIDLQFEEAPLIVKKSIMGEKCGSCNQLVSNMSNGTQYNSYQVNLPTQDENNRYRLRAIQDNSNKYNSGSYSRILSFSNPESLPVELKTSYNKSINPSASFTNILPDIKKKSNVNSPRRKVGASLNKIDEMNEEKYNSIIDEELEKKVVNPSVLLSASNKIYENYEKKSKN